MTLALLREVVQGVLSETRHVTLAAPYRSDLEQAVNWVKLNKQLRSAGDIQELDRDMYVVRLHVKGRHVDIEALVKDRFGYFVKVVR